MSNNISIRNIEPQEITINGAGQPTGITNVYVNGVDVTVGTKAYVLVPTETSELTNDSGFITNAQETDPTVPSYVKNISQADINSWNDKQNELVSTQNIKSINNQSILGSGNLNITTDYEAGTGIDITGNVISNTITSYTDLSDRPTLITNTSQLINDSGYITKDVDDLTNYLPTDVLESILPHASDSGTGDLNLENSAHYKLNIELNPSAAEQHTTTGKNILPNNGETKTQNGITFTKNDDGSVSVSGLASGDASYNLIVRTDPSYPAGTYIMNGCPAGGSVSTYYLYISPSASASRTDTGSGVTFSLTADETNIVSINIKSGYNANNNPLIFYPMLRDSSIVDGTYEEYTGGMQSPNPEYPQDIHTVNGENTITVCNKNILNLNEFTTLTQSGITLTPTFDEDKLLYITSSGTFSATTYMLLTNTQKIEPDTSYRLSGAYSASARLRLREFDANNSQLSEYYDSGSGVNFTSNSNVDHVNIQIVFYAQNNVKFYPMIVKGSTATSYVPHQETVYPINLQDLDLLSINTQWGKYENFIFKNTIDNPWYTYDVPGNVLTYGNRVYKYIFDSSDDWQLTDSGIFYLEFPNTVYFGTTKRFAISTHFLDRSLVNDDTTDSYIYTLGWELFVKFNANVGITTLQDFRDWIDDNDPIIVYAIRGGLQDNNPGASIIIRDTYSDLNNEWLDITEDSMAYDGGTNITQVNDDLPFEINADTLRKIS